MVQRKQSSPPKTKEDLKNHTELLYGFRASLAILEKRPDDILELYFSPDLEPKLATTLRWAQSRKIPCYKQDPRELTRLTETNHHEGLCVLSKERRWLPPLQLAEQLLHRKGVAIALDRVRNPYNIGAILRSAAFFGLDAVLLGAPAPHPALARDAVRVAEGGAEHLALSRTTNLADSLKMLRSKGVHVLGAESDGGSTLVNYPFRKPTVVVMGNEREGIGDRIRAQCDALIAIQGNGSIGSLNVSIAASLVISELVRR